MIEIEKCLKHDTCNISRIYWMFTFLTNCWSWLLTDHLPLDMTLIIACSSISWLLIRGVSFRCLLLLYINQFLIVPLLLVAHWIQEDLNRLSINVQFAHKDLFFVTRCGKTFKKLILNQNNQDNHISTQLKVKNVKKWMTFQFVISLLFILFLLIVLWFVERDILVDFFKNCFIGALSTAERNQLVNKWNTIENNT